MHNIKIKKLEHIFIRNDKYQLLQISYKERQMVGAYRTITEYVVEKHREIISSKLKITISEGCWQGIEHGIDR